MNCKRETMATVSGVLQVVMILCFLVLSTGAAAQVQSTSGISGLVTDPSGALVVGASVTATNEDTAEARKSVTNSAGFYSFTSIPPGTYTVTVESSGFSTVVVSHRAVLAAQPAIVDVSLQLGQQSERVDVSAAGAELVSPASAEIAATITPTLVSSVPIIRQNFIDLLTLVPGAVPQDASVGGMAISMMGPSDNSVQAGGEFTPTGIFLAGNRDSANNVSIDGANVQDSQFMGVSQLQTPAAIQEVKIQSGMMNAEFGNGVGAINVITKSGTNQLHGEVYEYLRNNHLDAADFFTNLLGRKLPNYQQNQYGFAVGGPFKRQKFFFFGNYEQFKLHQTAVAQEVVPTAAMLNGDLSSYHPLVNGAPGPTPTIYNPYQFDPVTGLRTPFPNNQIPLGPTNLCAPQPTCVDPVVLNFIQQWAAPSNAVVQGLPTFVGTLKARKDSSQGTVRLDYIRSSTSTFYGRGSIFTDNGESAGPLSLEIKANKIPGQSYVVHWTKALSSNLVNDLMVSYARPTILFGRPITGSLPDVSKQIGLQNVNTLAGGPTWSGTGFGLNNAPNVVVDDQTNVYETKDDLSMVKGSHVLKFGIERTERRLWTAAESGDKGQFNFNAFYSAACPLGNAACGTARDAAGLSQGGLAFADFLLGAPQQLFKVSRNYVYAGYQSYYGAYAQDTWRATSRLTVNAGLRYEYFAPYLVPRNTVVSFNFQTGLIEYGLQNPLDYLDPAKCFGRCAPLNTKIPRQGYTRPKLNLAPRLSFGYQLTSNTILRAGAGIYFDGNFNNDQMLDIQTGAGPFGFRYQLNTSGSEQLPPYLVDQQFPASSNNPTSIPSPTDTPPTAFRFVAGSYPPAAVYEWTMSVQQRLGRSWAAEINYLGSHTIHQQLFADMNGPVLPQGQFAGLTLQQRRTYPGWSSIGSWIPAGWAKYDGLTMSVKNTSWHGLTVMSNFTWAKGISSTLWGQSDQGIVWDYRYLNLYSGPFAATPKLRSVSGYSYQLPFGRGMAFASSSSPVLNGLVSGWSLSGILSLQSGTYDVAEGADTTGTGDSNGINRICDPHNVPGGRTYLKWFNTACFAPAPFGTLPNSPLGALTDPGINNWDISIRKTTRTGFPKESGRVDFEAGFYNAWNHVQWGNPTFNLTSANFGRISTTRPARQIQFSLKYVF